MTTVKIRLLYPTRSPSGHSFSLPTNDIRNKPELSPPAATVTLTVNKSTKNPVCSDPLFAYCQRDLQKPEPRIVTAVALVSLWELQSKTKVTHWPSSRNSTCSRQKAHSLNIFSRRHREDTLSVIWGWEFFSRTYSKELDISFCWKVLLKAISSVWCSSSTCKFWAKIFFFSP